MALTTVPVELASLDGAVTVNESSADADFRVESNGKTHALFIDGGNNQVLLNASTARSTSGVTASTQIHGTGYNDASLALIGDMGANALTAPVLFFAKTRGSAGGSTVVSDGDRLGAIFFNAGDGTDIESVAASIDAVIDGTPGSNDTPGRLVFRTSSDGSGDNAERMRIDSSGYALIGRTSASFGATTGIVFRPNNDSYVIVNEAPCLTLRRNTTNGDIMQFYRDGTQVGYISVTASATSYQSGSDYRLKDNVTYDWEALPRLAQLKPARFNFKVDPDSTVDGFLAHEAQAVVPNAVGGTYNETKDISNVVLDAEGNVLEEGVTEDDWKAGKEAEEGEEPKYAADTTWKAEHTKNIYQGMDHSKLVPLMVKAIQEQQTLIETLQAEVKALKGE